MDFKSIFNFTQEEKIINDIKLYNLLNMLVNNNDFIYLFQTNKYIFKIRKIKVFYSFQIESLTCNYHEKITGKKDTIFNEMTTYINLLDFRTQIMKINYNNKQQIFNKNSINLMLLKRFILQEGAGDFLYLNQNEEEEDEDEDEDEGEEEEEDENDPQIMEDLINFLRL
jgi:hypothetical protein